jgi:hypothetical protein
MPNLTIDKKTGQFFLKLQDFSGGLNTRDIDSKIRDNELSDVRNLTYDRLGALTIRKGQAIIVSTKWSDNPIKSGGGYYKYGETPEVILSSGTSIGKINTTLGVTDIKTGLTGDGLFTDMHQFMDKFFMSNGTDVGQVYNGTAVHDIGYPIPTANLSVAKNGTTGGLEAKLYYYKVTYYYEDGESNECAADVSITPDAGQSVALTNIPVDSTGRATQRRIYRTQGDLLVYKLHTVISDNTTTSMVDSLADNAMGADIETDNLTPPVYDFAVNHKGRMWFATGTTLWYSKALHPESVPLDYYWDIGKNDGDIITAIKVNLGSLVIFKRYSTWVLSGDLPTGSSADMVLSMVNPTLGCIHINTIAHAGNDLLFLAPNLGVFRLHRIILSTTDSMDAQPLSDKISTTINLLNKTYLDLACAESYNHKYYLSVPSATVVENDICLVLDLRNINPENERTIRWSIYDNYKFANLILFLDDSGEHLYGLSNVAGYVYELEKGTNDNGALIEAYATTKNYDLGSFLQVKTPRLLAVQGRASEDYTFTIRQFIQYKNTLYQDTKTFIGGGVASITDVYYDDIVYDSVLYDTDGAFIGTVIDFVKTTHLLRKFNMIKFKIEEIRANQAFAFYGYELRGFGGQSRPLE